MDVGYSYIDVEVIMNEGGLVNGLGYNKLKVYAHIMYF